MNITLITSNKNFESSFLKRVKDLGHNPKVINLREYYFLNNKDLSDNGLLSINKQNTDIVVVRGAYVLTKEVRIFLQKYKNEGIKVFDNNLLEDGYNISKNADFLEMSLAKIPTPITFFGSKFEDFLQHSKHFNFPLIIKDVAKSMGNGVLKINNRADLVTFISKKEKEKIKPNRFLMQEFIDYKHDLRVLVVGDKMNCMERIPKKGDFRANFSLGGSVKLFTLTNEIVDLTKKALKTVNLKVCGVDILVLKNNSLKVLELNHTPGFDGMRKATGEDIFKQYLETVIKYAK